MELPNGDVVTVVVELRGEQPMGPRVVVLPAAPAVGDVVSVDGVRCRVARREFVLAVDVEAGIVVHLEPEA